MEGCSSVLQPSHENGMMVYLVQLLTSAKYRVRSIAARAGVSIGADAPSWDHAFQQLEKAGLRPRTVFDIGVARGTPWLYKAFPDATFHLIDPTRESLKFMQSIARRYKAQIHNVALGDQETELEIAIPASSIGSSSFFEDVGASEIANRYTVPVRRFDQVAGKFERPALAKIDVQGAEILVLQGMVEHLADLDAIIIEVSTIATAKGAPEMGEVIDFFAKQGWSVADILSLCRRPLDGALAQVDLLFVPDNSPLRKDKRWSAS